MRMMRWESVWISEWKFSQINYMILLNFENFIFSRNLPASPPISQQPCQHQQIINLFSCLCVFMRCWIMCSKDKYWFIKYSGHGIDEIQYDINLLPMVIVSTLFWSISVYTLIRQSFDVRTLFATIPYSSLISSSSLQIRNVKAMRKADGMGMLLVVNIN